MCEEGNLKKVVVIIQKVIFELKKAVATCR